jgi:very-short-patch-repair endonuclease
MGSNQILPISGEVAAHRADGGGAARKQKQSLRRREVYEARTLRKTMTLPEVLLWREIKGNKLGVGFRKQHPIGDYKADFCYAAGKLVIEVDGFAHDTGDVATRDERRNAFMREEGYTVLRVPARDVLEDLGLVLDRIRLALAPLHHFVVPLPTSGEDLG